MRRLIFAFWSIARLRAGPQTLPASRFLLGLALALHWATGVVLGLFSMDAGLALFSALAGTLTMAALVHLLLSLKRLSSRFVQTATALAGAETLLGLVAVPISFWLFAAPEPDKAVPALLSLLVLGWNLALAGHVFRHALNVSQGVGLMAALGYIFASLSVANLVNPGP